MIIDLDKEALKTLVKGTSPAYSLLDNDLIKTLGYYNDNTGWRWNEKLDILSEDSLWNLYIMCKKSWK